MSTSSTMCAASAWCSPTGTTAPAISTSTNKAPKRARTRAAAAADGAAASAKRLREVGDQVVAVLDADRKADQRVGDAHARAPLRPHFVKNRMRDRNRQRSVVAEVGREHDAAQAIEKIEAVERR